MHSGWPNEELEDLIKTKKSLTDIDEEEGWFKKTTEQVYNLPDYLAVELTRICLANLAIRHSGGDLDNFTVSNEGVEDSLYRVIDLIKESIPNGD